MSIALLFLACSKDTPSVPEEEVVPAQCRNVHLDHLDADWTSVHGTTANPKIRMRISKVEDRYEAMYVDGSFTRRRMIGTKRERDVKFTEVPSAEKVASGDTSLVTISVRPRPQACALRANIGRTDAGAEVVAPTALEFMTFPVVQGVTFSFAPADEPLFLGEAAKHRAARDRELASAGGRNTQIEMGTVDVGTWSSVEADGDPACTYDMDLYFDDLRVDALSPMPAGEVADGQRHWLHAWDAPFSGNHHFEMFRYRTCAGGARELIAIAGVDAILL